MELLWIMTVSVSRPTTAARRQENAEFLTFNWRVSVWRKTGTRRIQLRQLERYCVTITRLTILGKSLHPFLPSSVH